MATTTQLASIGELYDFIDSVSVYPVKAGELAQLAQAEGFERPVIDFYRSFPDDEFFDDKDDLISRSEQIQIMSAEEVEQPWEVLRSPQE